MVENGLAEDGIWPLPTGDSYIYQSGIQIAGLIAPTAGFSWAGDTVGAFFVDFRGDQLDGSPLTSLLDSRDTADLRTWPQAALIRDTSVFATSLLGRTNVSREDYWTRYWDGSPTRLGGRKHPMGVVVDQRVMAFTGPGYNQDILYLVYTITNVTASDPAAYANIDPAVRNDYVALGAQFRQVNDTVFGIALPTGGYRIDSVFINEAMDPDITISGVSDNYSTLSVPFGTSIAYAAGFKEPLWSYPAEVFGAPGFAPAPGLVGAAFMRYPRDSAGTQIGIRIWTNLTGGSTSYPDPVGVDQLYRYVSGTSSPGTGDLACSNQGHQLLLKYCVAWQAKTDTRYNLSTGPFSLAPGHQQTVVLAYFFAPPRDTVLPYVASGDLQPGFPALGDTIAADSTKVRLIERIAGWVTQSDANADGVIEANEVKTWPGSLLNKAQLAQAFVNAKFLTPQAPAPPAFFLVPGDRTVTVVWVKSTSETTGDPYFAVASDPTSALYDPNFRQFDVEGYRVYRGLNPNGLQVIAQFDYAGTLMSDYVGAFDYPQCAPELGVETGCPAAFPATPDPAIHADHALIGAVIQIPLGGRVRATNGAIQVTRADTAITGGNSGFPPLVDNGVTFSFLDAGLLNSFSYYYAVTAFDVNSVRSGPTSLESPRLVKTATPRTTGNVANAVIVQGMYGDDSVALDPTRSFPPIDSATGTFNGPMPPANGTVFTLLTSATQVLPRGRIEARIDSVSAGLTGGLTPPLPTLFLTLSSGTDTLRQAIPLPQPAFNSTARFGCSPPYCGFRESVPLVLYDSGAARRYGGVVDSGIRVPVMLTGQVSGIGDNSPGMAVGAGRYALNNPASQYLAHSRWFDEGKTEPSDPTIVADPSPAHNSGQLTGVSAIWSPQAYRTDAAAPVNVFFRGYSYASTAWYPADFTVTWNADSSVTVRDQTHHVNLPVAANGGAGFGFVNLRAFSGPGITAANLSDGTGTTDVSLVSYHHLYAMPPVCVWWTISCIAMERKAQFEPLDFNSDGVADANGVVIVINGEAFFMAMAQIPAVGTKWHLRAVTGTMSATCTPSVGPAMTDCTAYTFTGFPFRPALAPGLSFVIDVQKAFAVDTLASGDLSKVHTVPDPFYVTNALATSDTQHIEFVHLPTRAIIRIYSVSGKLVAHLTHNDATGGGQEDWNVRSRDGTTVASGVYFYVVEGPDHRTKVGRFTVVTYRP
ncbi:MAG TPA: hypothetical protein VH113_02225 [Gemmatimonadales bacterium]|nr:hypothetical protein [Gemmatimonadales bacterium]